jgi:murein DD-endopeptidase MepM/ murein hydrolase activator NlpD
MIRFAALAVAGVALLCTAFLAHADIVSELKEKIAERNTARTLQSVIRSIDLEQKKLTAQIKVTEARIGAVTLTIRGLSEDIAKKEQHIGENRSAIAEAIRAIYEAEQTTLIEALLSGRTLAVFWEQVDSLERFQSGVKSDLHATEKLKAELEDTKERDEKNRAELVLLKRELKDQNELLAQNRRDKKSLLAATKNEETEYRKLLAQKVARRNAFEQELLRFESELQLAIDPSKLPSAGSGVLKWPLDAVRLTQEFGDTAFARSGAYNGAGHNGVDFRAPNGTPIKAALGGVVRGTGNTDTVCPGASYGKWVLIEHGNGLSTLYAHFSLIKVSEGQEVTTGEVIGYSGETGYATGPHLHFTVYATQGVRVMQRKSAVCGGTYRMPIADLKAYLNPLSYL